MRESVSSIELSVISNHPKLWQDPVFCQPKELIPLLAPRCTQPTYITLHGVSIRSWAFFFGIGQRSMVNVGWNMLHMELNPRADHDSQNVAHLKISGNALMWGPIKKEFFHSLPEHIFLQRWVEPSWSVHNIANAWRDDAGCSMGYYWILRYQTQSHLPLMQKSGEICHC